MKKPTDQPPESFDMRTLREVIALLSALEPDDRRRLLRSIAAYYGGEYREGRS